MQLQNDTRGSPGRLKIILGLPLLVIAVAVMLFATFSTTGTVQAADDTGQLATDGLQVDGAVEPDIGIGSTQIQRDGADVTIGTTGFALEPGLGGWAIEVTYDDDVVTATISPATTTVDDDLATIGIDSSVIVNDDTGSGGKISLAVVTEDPATTDISGLGLATDEGRGVLPALYVAATLGLIILAIIAVTTTLRTRGAFATGFTSAGARMDFKSDGGRQSRAGPIESMMGSLISAVTHLFLRTSDETTQAQDAATTRLTRHPTHPVEQRSVGQLMTTGANKHDSATTSHST